MNMPLHVGRHVFGGLTALALGVSMLGGAACALDRSNATFRPGEPWLDDNGVHINAHGGGVLFHEGVYYWFGEHKGSGRAGYHAHVGVHCYSSRDLYRWKDEGIALAVSDDPTSEIAKGCVLERPKVIWNRRTNRFVMWFHLEFKGTGYETARTAVAVADAVTGPYRYLRSVRPNAGRWPADEQPPSRGNGGILHRDFADGQMARDMTVFVDDDGKAFHVHASEENRTLHIAELTDDYGDFTGRYVRVFPGGYNEAPALFKHAGKYYMLSSGCTGWKPNPARSAVADSIWGPWKALGNPCVGENRETRVGPERTFGGQSTFVLPVADKPGAFIAMFDIWHPRDHIDSRHMWLPIEFTADGRFLIRYRSAWDLSVFDDSAMTGANTR